MKKLLAIFLSIGIPLGCSLAFGQQSIANLLATSKEATLKIYFIYDLDVLHYFQLDSIDTELKKEMFKKTPEYQNYLEQLKGIKEEMFRTTYFIENFKNLPDYDVKQRGFIISLNTILGLDGKQPDDEAIPPKSLLIDSDSYLLSNKSEGHFIHCTSLPTKQIPYHCLGQTLYDEQFFIPIDETNGAEIEKNRDDINVYFFFTPSPSPKEIIQFRFFNYLNWENVTNKELKTDKIRVVLANNESGKIYFDKTYASQPHIKEQTH